MSLASGTRLGPYEILSALGAGGMGEVYKARDTRLDRTVAVKILPEVLAADPQFRERFDREARAVSQLDHPHICALYDVGEQAGTAYLVMQYLEGETLQDRLAKGALPLDEGLRTAIEIASALDKAHRAGIVHRDLKPGNIMLTKTGAKLLDFGLAKATAPVVTGSLSILPTTPPNLTAQGTILGTFQYMAPEQLEGQEADARTDIFAFGAVLYEMLAGKKAFEGKSQASLIAAIIHVDPPAISSAQPLTPPSLDHIVKRCLAKDPDDRWQSTSDLMRELKWTGEGALQTPVKPVDASTSGRLPVSLATTAMVAVLAAAVSGLTVWTLRPRGQQASTAITRLTMALPAGDDLWLGFDGPALALSPDGATLAYVGRHNNQQQLYVRPLDSLDAKAVAGTEGALSPFFSPNGQWVGFFAQGKLKKTPIAGGVVQELASAPSQRGGVWGPDNTIYFAPANVTGLWKVPANGGAAQEVTILDRAKGDVSHRWPQLLPGGKALLFTVWTGPGRDERHVEVQVLQTGERRVLAQGAETGRYVLSGHLVYARAGADTLMAVPMDLDRLEVANTAPAMLAEHVRVGEGAQYAVSDAGSLVYGRGGTQRLERRLEWVDRRGSIEAVPVPPRQYAAVALSRDGHRAALEASDNAYDIWIYDFARSILTKLITGGSSQAPVWTPDGRHIVYRATRSGSRNLFWKAVDNGSPEERLTTGDGTQTPASFSSDGTLLAFNQNTGGAGFHIGVLSIAGDRKPQNVLTTANTVERNPQFSPDGRWLAYESGESDRVEVYVQPFPSLDRKWLISADGGTEPRWSPNGRELFYRSGDKFMAVEVNMQPTFSPASPRLLFQGRGIPSQTASTGFGVSLDGQRFLMVEPVESQARVTGIEVVMNWFTELRGLATPRP